MKIKIFGTRGSVPISNSKSIRYGGNTTCLRLYDGSIPDDLALVIDAGTGFIPMGNEIMANNAKDKIQIMFTHYHHDHTMGLFLSPLTFIKKFDIDLFGPLDNGVGCKEMMEHLMVQPYFPVDVRQVRSHFTYSGVNNPHSKILVIHKEGTKIVDLDHYELIMKHDEFVPIGKGKYPLSEFIVIKMHKTRHPEKTFSYRFETNQDGKVFVFLTDHENGDGIPISMVEHCKDADLMIIDCQYNRNQYDGGFSGYGHGTPDYVVRLAEKANVKQVGLTHHDPSSSDDDIDNLVKEAVGCLTPGKEKVPYIFACRDFMEIDI